MKQVLVLLVATLVGVSLLPIQHTVAPPFANSAFQRLWATQSAAAAAEIDLWGNEPLLWRVEPYANAPGGRRIVQYFDRGRMELTPTADGKQTIVTQGLLALEMTTGKILLGDQLTESQPPPRIPIDGGPPDDRVATYAALSTVVQRRAPDRVGKGNLPVQWINSTGTTDAPPVVALQAGDYVELTGHNIPDVVSAFFDRQPFGGGSWVEALGYPISEPFWTIYRRSGTPLPSLIQVFQRRILVYTPGTTSEHKFTVANTGRHYYRWRYGTDPPRQWPNPQPGISDLRITVPVGFDAGIYAQDLGTPIGLAIGPAGDLWILTEEGRVLRVDSENPDGSADHITVFAQNLANPRGIAIQGDTVYVAVDDGIMVLQDGNMDGAADSQTYYSRAVEPATGTRGAPAIDTNGRVFVAGARVSNSQEHVVAQIAPSGDVSAVPGGFANPGPVMVVGRQLYVLDRSVGGDPLLYRMSLLSSPADSSGDTGVGPPLLAAKFSQGSTVNSVLLFDSGLWPQVPSNTLFAAVSRGDSGSIIRAEPRADGTPPELVDFATGFSRPVAMAVGLDGTLYVADAGRSQVIKIIAPPVSK